MFVIRSILAGLLIVATSLTWPAAESASAQPVNCSVIIEGVRDGAVELDFYESVCGSSGSPNEIIASALASGLVGELSQLETDPRNASLAERIIAEDAYTRDAFFENLRTEEALDWFRDIVRAGFDPNLIVNSEHPRSVLHYALNENNVAAAIVLLEEGASPHTFQRVWGTESENIYLVDPLARLSDLSVSQDEKEQLVRAMVAAGLAVLVASPSGSYSFDHPSPNRYHSLFEEYEIDRETVDAMRRDRRVCRNRSFASEIDWCAEVAAVPQFVEDITGAGTGVFAGFHIGNLIGIYDERMHFFALGSGGTWNGYPPSIAVVNRGADRIVFYRHSRNSAGLGHCSRLRARAAGLEPGDYIDADRDARCWRRLILTRTPGQEGYDGIWPQSYYCRNSELDGAVLREVEYRGQSWSEVDLATRMEGRHPC